MNPRIAIAFGALALGGCVAYPVYQPAPVARLTPAQSDALASRPIDPAESARIAQDNAQVQREDQADIDAQRQAYTYAYPATPYYYGTPYYAAPYGYYGGFYPWAPALSLSFGYSRGWGGYRGGYRGGHGAWRGGGRWHR